jgi:hypothetical protein
MSEMTVSARLRALYDADRHEHSAVPPVTTPAYAALRERDAARRAEARKLLQPLESAGDAKPIDSYHAAWLLNHGDTPDDAYEAHELARAAALDGYAPARWLAAAAYDRWCMYRGLPQKYGTQIVPDGERYRLWDLDGETTDAERAQWDVPPLSAQRARAEEMTRSEPQPPMDKAPEWLQMALRRWTIEAKWG